MATKAHSLIALLLAGYSTAFRTDIAYSDANRTAFADAIPVHTESGEASAASYKLVQTYDASNFFNGFTFFTDADPTQYVLLLLSQTDYWGVLSARNQHHFVQPSKTDCVQTLIDIG